MSTMDRATHDRFGGIADEDRRVLGEALNDAARGASGERRQAYLDLAREVEPPVAVSTYEDDEIKAELFQVGTRYRGVVTEVTKDSDPFVTQITPGLHAFDAMATLLGRYADECS